MATDSTLNLEDGDEVGELQRRSFDGFWSASVSSVL